MLELIMANLYLWISGLERLPQRSSAQISRRELTETILSNWTLAVHTSHTSAGPNTDTTGITKQCEIKMDFVCVNDEQLCAHEITRHNMEHF